MKVAAITFNDSGATKISFSQDFYTSDRITQLDILSDLMCDFDNLYNILLDQKEGILCKQDVKEITSFQA